MLRAFENFFQTSRFGVRPEGDDRFLPVRRFAGALAAELLDLAFDNQRIDVGDRNVEQLLNGLADFNLVGAGAAAERVTSLLAHLHTFFRDDRTFDDLLKCFAHAASASLVLPDSLFSVPSM